MDPEQSAGVPKQPTSCVSGNAGYMERGSRLLKEVVQYVPGLTRDRAAEIADTVPEHIVKLSSNENPLGPSRKAVAAVAGAAATLHEYPESTAAQFRAAVAQYLGVLPPQVVVGAGSSSLMHSVVEAFTTPGGEVLSLDPGFDAYAEIAVIHGRESRRIKLRHSDFSLDISVLRQLITANTQLIILTRPNNPTSTLIPLETLAEAAHLGANVGALVVSDEAYIEFADVPRQSAVELLLASSRTYDNVLCMRTMSKAFGLAGLRLGYAIASSDVAACLARANVKWPTGTLTQVAGVAALTDREHLARTVETVSAQRRRLISVLGALGFRVAPEPQGNYVMVDVSPMGMSAEMFTRRLLELGRVLVRGDFSDRYVRVSIGRPDEVDRLLDTIRCLVGSIRNAR